MAGKPIWLILFAIWAIATGILALTNLTITAAPIILAVLLIAVGIFALLGK